MTVAVVLLAAGRSTRFGAADKLAAPLNGMPLGFHAARTLATLALPLSVVVTGPTTLEWPGFERIVNDRPDAGMGRSLALGVAAARELGASAILVALADMPRVPAAHFRKLLARDILPDTRVGSTDGIRRLPPALFGAGWFPALESLDGDQGARMLLVDAEVVAAPTNALVDIDSEDDLAALGETQKWWWLGSSQPPSASQS